jgi:hypothetical protein
MKVLVNDLDDALLFIDLAIELEPTFYEYYN